MWKDSFPDRSSPKFMNECFLPIVSGKKKFTGVNELQMEDDGTKYWDADRDGNPNKSFPLIQSWEDVIKYKQVKLYVSELGLRQWRLQRRYPEYFEGAEGSSLMWEAACEENKKENYLRQDVNTHYTEIRNLTREIFPDEEYSNIIPLPDGEIPLITSPNMKNKYDYSDYEQCVDMYESIMSRIGPVRDYFNKKYGYIHLFNEDEIKYICGLDDEMIHRMETSKKVKKQKFFRDESDEPKVTSILPKDIDVMDFIEKQIKESEREKIEAEDPLKTEWHSGYIDRSGKFYGCSDTQHVAFSEEICEQFGFEIPEKKEEIKWAILKDAEVVLDDKGWVKVSMFRFFWDHYNTKPNKKQQKTILDLMLNYKITETDFEYVNNKKTFQQQFGD